MNEKQEKVLRRLQILQNRIPLIWDGNPKERAVHVSPHAFAAEVIEASEGRAALREELNAIIDDIAKEFFDSRLLVLPIDDLHENPNVALGILRLMRLIHSHHLVILTLGNLHSLRTIEELRARQQLTSFFHETDAVDPRLPPEAWKRAATLGAFSMDKLFCRSQTIIIYPPDTDLSYDWDKIKAFTPCGTPAGMPLVHLFSSTLKKSFKKTHEEEREVFPEEKYDKIFEFLEADESVKTDESVKADELHKERRRLFKMPIRSLVSMYRILEGGFGEGGFEKRGLDYPIVFCQEMLEQVALPEYNRDDPSDLFEFHTENINIIRLSDRYKELPSMKSTGSLVTVEDGDVSTEQRPAVAAWTHLLLCLSDKELRGRRVIRKKKKAS